MKFFTTPLAGDNHNDHHELVQNNSDHPNDDAKKNKLIRMSFGIFLFALLGLAMCYSFDNANNKGDDKIPITIDRDTRIGIDLADEMIADLDEFSDLDQEEQLMAEHRQTRKFTWSWTSQDNYPITRMNASSTSTQNLSNRNQNHMSSSLSSWSTWSSWSSLDGSDSRYSQNSNFNNRNRGHTQNGVPGYDNKQSKWPNHQQNHQQVFSITNDDGSSYTRQQLKRLNKKSLITFALKVSKELGKNTIKLKKINRKFKNQQKSCSRSKIQQQCYKQKFDLTIILDGSGSIKSEDYKRSVDFVRDLVKYLDLDSVNGASVNLMQFSDKVRWYASLESNSRKLNSALDMMHG